MFLSIATTCRPATDLGFLLHKHPDRLHEIELTFGKAWVFYPEADNAEYNALFPNLAAGRFRHPDHRFEWTRAEFAAWTGRIAETYGYRPALSGIGTEDNALGAPTQMAVFSR
jgi:hypothetical protein